MHSHSHLAFLPISTLPFNCNQFRLRPTPHQHSFQVKQSPHPILCDMNPLDNSINETKPVTSSKKAARRSLSNITVPNFMEKVRSQDPHINSLHRQTVTTLQINIGLTCNLACRHCHVESSPSRIESMPKFIADRVLQLAKRTPSLQTVDITGGAPEMHAEFRPLVRAFASRGLSMIDRCNLTILKTQPDLPEFLAEHRVKVVASLPCYSAENVERQRGNGVFDDSIAALQRLNEVGYGVEGSGLELDLVYNPGSAVLPPSQKELERDYKRELKRVFGIEFSNLICITNMPIKRFADDLIIRGKLTEYMQLLVDSYNKDTLQSVMCRDMVHVAYDGSIHDCDFNYALDISAKWPEQRDGNTSGKKLSIFDVDSFDEIANMPIATGKHCFGCTAGSGSSCGGSLA